MICLASLLIFKTDKLSIHIAAEELSRTSPDWALRVPASRGERPGPNEEAEAANGTGTFPQPQRGTFVYKCLHCLKGLQKVFLKVFQVGKMNGKGPMALLLPWKKKQVDPPAP